MKKRWHTLLFLQLCFLLALTGMGSRNADAKVKNEEDWSYSVLKDGTVEVDGYLGMKVKHLGIPETINGKTVTAIRKDMMLENGKEVESLEIPSGVTHISKDAFSESRNLKTITVSPKNNKYDSRNNCNAIIETETNTLMIGCSTTKIPLGITKIGDGAFDACAGLESITIPSGVTDIGANAFYGCDKLKSVEIPVGTESIGSYAFGCCSALKKVTIPDTVKRIGHEAFVSCKKLQSIKIPSNVKRIEYETFFNCESLKKVIISEGVTEIGRDAFWYCDKLKTVQMPSSLKIMRIRAFRRCKSLRKITIPSGVTKIGWGAFAYCHKLKYITIKSKELDMVKTNALKGIHKNAVIKVPKGKREAYRELFSPRTGYRKTMKIK